MPKKWTRDEYLEKHRRDGWDYQRMVYVNTSTKAVFGCPEGHWFEQRPADHAKGIGCPHCAGKFHHTTETYLEKHRRDGWNYSHFQYVNTETKATIGCPEGHWFEQRPADHSKGHGCPHCAGNVQLTTETYLEKHRRDGWEYSRFEYAGSHAKAVFGCPDGHWFEQTPAGHSQGIGCPHCAGTAQPTTETWLDKHRRDGFDYSRFEYVTSKTKATIGCPDGHWFEQRPGDHSKGQGCPHCAGSFPLTTETWLAKHARDDTDYSDLVYVNSGSKVTFICKAEGHRYEQAPSDHAQGRGCPHCAVSGFKTNMPATLYYLRVDGHNGQQLYKIGITNQTVQKRFYQVDLERITVLHEWPFGSGQDAYDTEQLLMRRYKSDQYTGEPVLVSGGNTELFTTDVFAGLFEAAA